MYIYLLVCLFIKLDILIIKYFLLDTTLLQVIAFSLESSEKMKNNIWHYFIFHLFY